MEARRHGDASSILLTALLSGATLVALAACDGGSDDGLIAIDRHEGEAEPLTLEDRYNPPFASEYPDIVAEVNGEPISGEALAVAVAGEISARWQYTSGEFATEIPEDLLAGQLDDLEVSDPLEDLIDRELLRQAAEERGLMPSYEDAADYTREQEERFMAPSPTRSVEDVFALLTGLDAVGYPRSDWASDPEIVETYRTNLGIGELRETECEPGRLDTGEVSPLVPNDCTAFLDELRERAKIVYFVRWAD